MASGPLYIIQTYLHVVSGGSCRCQDYFSHSQKQWKSCGPLCVLPAKCFQNQPKEGISQRIFPLLRFTLYLQSVKAAETMELDDTCYSYICGNQASIVHRIHPQWQVSSHRHTQTLELVTFYMRVNIITPVIKNVDLRHRAHCVQPWLQLVCIVGIYLGLLLLANGGGLASVIIDIGTHFCPHTLLDQAQLLPSNVLYILTTVSKWAWTNGNCWFLWRLVFLCHP